MGDYGMANLAERNMQSMTYISQLLWHFVRDRKGSDKVPAASSFEILNREILGNDGAGKLKQYPNPTATPPWDKFYVRTVRVEVPAGSLFNLNESTAELEARSSKDLGDLLQLLEPRAVCFADIPFNFLPIHMERYSGIGLGFRRKVLTRSYDRLRPVSYIPRLSRDSIEEVIRNREINELSPYIKVESVDSASNNMDGEPFEAIYREREWRVLHDVDFDHDALACIVFRNAKELEDAHASDSFAPLIKRRIALLNREDFFEDSILEGEEA
jgi:hypothetical protein